MAVYYVSSYSFKTHKNTGNWNLLNLSTGNSSVVFTSEVSEVVWLSDSTVLYINGTNSAIVGGVELWVADVTGRAKR